MSANEANARINRRVEIIHNALLATESPVNIPFIMARLENELNAAATFADKLDVLKQYEQWYVTGSEA
jgi:hypothetical protein